MKRPKVGVSACLLGERVRYDGDHRRESFVAEALSRRFEWVVICPEVEAGFGVPRETLQLEGSPEAPRLLTTQTRRDVTERMRAWCRTRAAALPDDLAGFIFKARSPSCGPVGAKLHRPGADEPEATGVGLFVDAVFTRFPDLPIIDEEGLRDQERAAAFLRAVEARSTTRES